jgi:hypothetical protein
MPVSNAPEILRWLEPTFEVLIDWDADYDDAGELRIVYTNPLMTQRTIAQIMEHEAAWLVAGGTLANMRQRAKAHLDEVNELEMRLRAIMLLAADEVNLLREWIMLFKAAVAGAGTLAALKTAVAALPNLDQRTKPQVLTRWRTKIDSKAADSST